MSGRGNFSKQEMAQEQRCHAVYFCLLDKVVPGLEIGAGMNKQFLLKWMRLYSGAEVKEREHRMKELNQGWVWRNQPGKIPADCLLASSPSG